MQKAVASRRIILVNVKVYFTQSRKEMLRTQSETFLFAE
jgi:hypothetical protein